MRHYEIVLLVHPDQSEQVPAMLAKYQDMLTADNGVVHRSEDWGRMKLAYAIAEVHKAHYLMMNVECALETLRELEKNFKFNDSILRSLVIRRKHAVTEQSALARAKVESDLEEEREKARETEREKERIESEKKAALFAKENPVVVADEPVPAKAGGADDGDSNSDSNSDSADTVTDEPATVTDENPAEENADEKPADESTEPKPETI